MKTSPTGISANSIGSGAEPSALAVVIEMFNPLHNDGRQRCRNLQRLHQQPLLAVQVSIEVTYDPVNEAELRRLISELVNLLAYESGFQPPS